MLQGPPGRPGLPGADGLAGPPGTMLMLPVSAHSTEVHTSHLLSYVITRLISWFELFNACVCVCSTVPVWWGRGEGPSGVSPRSPGPGHPVPGQSK